MSSYACAIEGAATCGKAAFQCGSRVYILFQLIGQYHPYIAEVVFYKIIIHEPGGGMGWRRHQRQL